MNFSRLLRVRINQIDLCDEYIVPKEKCYDLIDHLIIHGLLSPVDVSIKGGRYLLFNGYRRLAACKALGMEHIIANVYEATDEEIKQFNLGIKIDIYLKPYNIYIGLT